MKTTQWLFGMLLFAGCAGASSGLDDGESDSPNTTVDVQPANAVVGGKAHVTASSLNLRDGAGTSFAVITVMSMGDQVDVIGYSKGWYNVTYQGQTGWCSGTYLTPDVGGGGSTGGSTAIDAAIARAESGVGFSYHWGAGCWDPSSTAHGACYGSCPNCSHSGTWGADCSGYVAKIWQVPGASAVTACAHPYSSYDFYNSTDHWADVTRANVQRGDAFVHNNGSSGHIFIYDSGDAWGWVMAYEAKGCSYGVQHDSRMASSAYKAIRRDGY